MKLNTLFLWDTHQIADVAFQMALDEALFHFSRGHDLAVARFYHWDQPALTFGYSEPCPRGATLTAIRRFTGGGLVEHEKDLTLLLSFPASSGVARETAPIRYEWIHQAIADALRPPGVSLHLAGPKPLRPSGPCFETPVLSDLICDETGEKAGGGAQRRSRGAVIHQGSIRLTKRLREDHHEWTAPFLASLARKVLPFPDSSREEVLAEAENLRSTRYDTEDWNHRR